MKETFRLSMKETFRLSSKTRALLLAGLGILGSAPAQGDPDLVRIRELQERRTRILAMVEPAVCSVMSLKRPGGGSGVIFSPQGWILSNYHVTRTNPTMKIGLPDGKLYLADVIGIDPGGDIAVLALRGKGPRPGGSWPFVRLGDSDKLKIGGFAYAMGNPFLLASDFKPTVTMGVVSGIHRYQKGTGPNQRMLVYPDCVQIDAPVNPGNSGGPLFDENGLLVGINGRITIRDRGRVNTGVGFAVSINQIKNFLPDLLAGKWTEHGTLDMNAWLYEEDPNTGLKEPGIFVQALFEDSVAAEVGVQTGARILAFDGVPVRFANDVAREVGILPAGFEVSLTFQNFDEKTLGYFPPRTEHLRLAALDTGSRNRSHLVPDFENRPDFDALEKEAAKRKAESRELRDWWKDLDPEKQKLWRLRIRKALKLEPSEPGKKKDGEEEEEEEEEEREKDQEKPLEGSWEEWRRELPFDLKNPEDLWKRFPIPGLKPPKGGKKEKPRDLIREKAVYAFMDGLMETLAGGFGRSLGGLAEGADRSFTVLVTPRKKRGSNKVRRRTYRVRGKLLEIEEEGRDLLSTEEEDPGLRAGLLRARDMNPLLRPHVLAEALKEAWLEGGAHIGGRGAWVLRLRGPGKRTLFLDQRGFFPLGYRYRDFRRGGVLEVRFTGFRKEGERLHPSRARLLLGGELAEEWTFLPGGSPAGFLDAGEPAPPLPRGEIEARLAPVFKSVVKIFGAGGFKGLEGYETGIVISPKGHILTWNHILLQPNMTRVVLEDGSVHRARIVRKWEDHEIAVIKIDPVDRKGRPLPLVPIEFPTEPRTIPPGTVVYSVGNAFKIAEYSERLSVMIGVVVGHVRTDLRLNLRKMKYRGEAMIVDAPLGPGSQGGGLFSIEGELLGVLAPIVESRETNSQLYLAIPAHALSPIVAYHNGNKAMAAELFRKIKASGEKQPVFTGILLFQAGRRRSPPAYVDRVIPGSPAASAGLRSDDMIFRINDFPIQNCAEFHRALREFGPGERIDITFKRGNTVRKVHLRLEEVK